MALNFIIILLGHLMWCCKLMDRLLKKLVGHSGTWQGDIGMKIAKLLRQYMFCVKYLVYKISFKITGERMEEKNEKVLL